MPIVKRRGSVLYGLIWYTKHMIQILLLYALCASSFTICKSVLLYAKPIFFIGIRMLLSGLLLTTAYWFGKTALWVQIKKKCGIAVGQRGSAPVFAKSHIWLFIQVILFHVYLAYIFDLWALQYISSFKSCLMFNLSPFIAALFSYYIFAERLSGKRWLGLIIGCMGIIPQLTSIQTADLSVALPDLVMFGAVASSVYGWMLVKKLMHYNYSISFINGIGMIGGGVLALASSCWIEGVSESPVGDFWPFLKLLVLIILIINVLFYNLYGLLLKRYSPTLLSFAGFITPFFAAFYGWFFLHESVSWQFFVSLAVVSIGLYLFYQEELSSSTAAELI